MATEMRMEGRREGENTDRKEEEERGGGTVSGVSGRVRDTEDFNDTCLLESENWGAIDLAEEEGPCAPPFPHFSPPRGVV